MKHILAELLQAYQRAHVILEADKEMNSLGDMIGVCLALTEYSVLVRAFVQSTLLNQQQVVLFLCRVT